MLQIAQFEKLLFCREVTFKGVCNFTFGYYKEKDELKGGTQKSAGRTLREGQAKISFGDEGYSQFSQIPPPGEALLKQPLQIKF